ncbi:MAG TPA: hypothetical protein VGK70_13635 [Thermoanaerobaculia bacterium]|jgi:hypothetical protein
MNGAARRQTSKLVHLSMLATLAALLTSLPLLFRETAYTLVLFMFVAQPLFAVGFSLFVWKVFRDLRRKALL